MCGRFCHKLRAAEPGSRPVLDVLGERHVLHAYTAETDQTVVELLWRVLAEPRTAGMAPRHVYWGLLERLYNPVTNTQIVNVEFQDGSLDATTCVSAAHAFVLCQRTPGEYARIVERLTSVDQRFPITRSYAPHVIAQRCRWLAGAFPAERLSDHLVRIWIHPDDNAAPRAIAEQYGRLFREYDFGARGRRNSRMLGDVMLQSALTNYAMHDEYDSAGDCHRANGARGLPPPDQSPGHQALIEDLGSGPTPPLKPRGSLVLGVMTPEQAIRAADDQWTGGHYLAHSLLIDIDR